MRKMKVLPISLIFFIGMVAAEWVKSEEKKFISGSEISNNYLKNNLTLFLNNRLFLISLIIILIIIVFIILKKNKKINKIPYINKKRKKF